MISDNSSLAECVNEEIPALIETLLTTEQRLEELTAGEVDTVAGRDGRTFVLRRAQDQLRHSEATKQADILNALPAHLALLDTQGNIISVNEAWRQFADANLLTSPEHAVGMNYLGICDQARGDDSSEAHQVAAGVRAVLDGEAKSFSIEYPCHSPTEARWFLLTVTPLASDRPNGAVVMHLNITDRKLAAAAFEALSEKTDRRERMLTTMLSNLQDFAYIYDRAGCFLFANKTLLDLWGLTLDSVVGKNFYELGYPDDLARRLQQEVQDVFGTGKSITGETPYDSPTGVQGFYEYIFSPAFGGDGTVEFVVGSTRDITKRKKAEAALQISQKQVRDIIDGMGPSMFVGLLTPQGILVEVNQSPLTAAGLKAENVLGKPFDETPWWSQSPAVQRQLREAIVRAAHGEASRYDVRTHGADNQVIDIDFSLQPLRDETGEVTFLIPSANVITERKLAETALRETELRLVHAMRMAQLVAWEYDPATGFFTFNENYYAFHGTTAELEGGNLM
ncbi:MAG: PAS domain-containing protein, partial [Aureliella sp.]